MPGGMAGGACCAAWPPLGRQSSTGYRRGRQLQVRFGGATPAQQIQQQGQAERVNQVLLAVVPCRKRQCQFHR